MDEDPELTEALNRFAFHPANTASRVAAHERVRAMCAELLVDLWGVVPASDERTRMLDTLDDVCKHANAAVARHWPETV